MPKLSVHLFGKFNVTCTAQTVLSLTSRKTQELFCYLLLHQDRPHSREMLAGLLWDDTTTEQSKTYLRKALWQLQTTLDPHTERLQGSILLVDHDSVQINPCADLWLDVAAFEQAFHSVQGISGERLPSHVAASLQCAVDLYHGDLLDGWYQDWCLYERERLQNIYLALLDKLMAYCEAHQEYESGLDYGARILRYDHAREQAHRRMMRLYALSGDRTAALRQFERCVKVLAAEFRIPPSACTRQLHEQIMRNQLDDGGTDERPATPEGRAPLADILSHLQQFQSTLASLQQYLQHHIQAMEQVLRGQP
jgi:DNA-binding SARP family transcriptional activator